MLMAKYKVFDLLYAYGQSNSLGKTGLSGSTAEWPTISPDALNGDTLYNNTKLSLVVDGVFAISNV